MRGLYRIPTQNRRSEWYSIPGKFTAKLSPERDYVQKDLLSPKPNYLSFQPDNSPVEFALIPVAAQPESMHESMIRKTIMVGCGVYGGSTRNWSSALWLRKITPVNGETYWNILIKSSHICICDAIIVAAGEEYRAQIIQDLLPFASRIEWPESIPNDESGKALPPVDTSSLDTELWDKLKKLFLRTFPLEPDQVHPDVTLGDLQADFWDVAVLWSNFSEIIDNDFDENEELINEILAHSTTLREIHDYLLTVRMREDA